MVPGRNLIHGSDSVESANKEVALWFRPEELSAWRPALVEWLYEEEELDKDKPQPKPVGFAMVVWCDACLAQPGARELCFVPSDLATFKQEI